MNLENNLKENLFNLKSKYDKDVNFYHMELKSLLISTTNILTFDYNIFKNNNDLNLFYKDIFDIELKPYVIANRTLMSGTISRYIQSEISINVLENYLNKLNRFLNKAYDSKNINYLDSIRGL